MHTMLDYLYIYNYSKNDKSYWDTYIYIYRKFSH